MLMEVTIGLCDWCCCFGEDSIRDGGRGVGWDGVVQLALDRG
jgi:hypothetical protein